MIELHTHVDLKALGVRLAVVHQKSSDAEHTLITAEKQMIKTVRAAEDRPKNRKVASGEAVYGVPQEESTNIWILTTWQTLEQSVVNNLADKHPYKGKKDEGNKEQIIDRFHCGLAIVDEAHVVKTPSRGSWRRLANMIRARPSLRLWLAAMLETFIIGHSNHLAEVMS